MTNFYFILISVYLFQGGWWKKTHDFRLCASQFQTVCSSTTKGTCEMHRLVTVMDRTCQKQFAKIRVVDAFTYQGSIEHLKWESSNRRCTTWELASSCCFNVWAIITLHGFCCSKQLSTLERYSWPLFCCQFFMDYYLQRSFFYNSMV